LKMEEELNLPFTDDQPLEIIAPTMRQTPNGMFPHVIYDDTSIFVKYFPPCDGKVDERAQYYTLAPQFDVPSSQIKTTLAKYFHSNFGSVPSSNNFRLGFLPNQSACNNCHGPKDNIDCSNKRCIKCTSWQACQFANVAKHQNVIKELRIKISEDKKYWINSSLAALSALHRSRVGHFTGGADHQQVERAITEGDVAYMELLQQVIQNPVNQAHTESQYDQTSFELIRRSATPNPSPIRPEFTPIRTPPGLVRQPSTPVQLSTPLFTLSTPEPIEVSN